MSSPAVAVEWVADRERPRRALSGAGLLFAALGGSGLLTYAFHVLAARSLGPAAYGQIAVLWAAMFVVAIVLFRPVEQTASRSIAERLARGEEAHSVLRTAAVLCAAALAVVLLAGAAAWETVGDRLFAGDGAMTAMLAAGIAIYALAYLVRGLLAGVGWFGGYGLALVADTTGRLALALPLVVVASRHLAAAAVVTAGIVGVVIPGALRARRVLGRLDGADGGRFQLGAALAFAAPASVIAAADQLLVNGGPLLVVLFGGADAGTAAGVVFAATMLVRVPVYLFQGLATSLLPNLTHMNALEGGARARRAVTRIVALMLGAGTAIVVPAAAVGPETMRLLYGPGFDAGRREMALLGAGVACYLAAATCSQALLALGRPGRAAVAWVAVSTVFVALAAATPGDELHRISVAFAAAALVAVIALATLLLARRSQ